MQPVVIEEYEEALQVRIGTGREILRQLVLKARQRKMRIVFAEGANETVLRACGILMDEGLGSPILLGPEPAVRATAEKIGVDLGGATVLDPLKSPRLEHHAQGYFRLRGRRGVTPEMAQFRMAEPAYFGAMMLHSGEADMMICGVMSHFSESMSTVLRVIGPGSGVRRVSSLYMVCRFQETYFLADCAVNIDPTAQDLAETALLAACTVRSLGIEPRVAMLSFSNFGSVDHPFAARVREATRLAQEQSPDLIIDGEVQLATALDAELRHRYFPFSRLDENANVLIFPDLQSGSMALQVLRELGDSILVGPVLLGTRLPVHVVQQGTTAEDLIRLTVFGIVTAATP
jgi:malate dehydrogenase (oxaloacetate-decarboxylating)(NADP+)